VGGGEEEDSSLSCLKMPIRHRVIQFIQKPVKKSGEGVGFRQEGSERRGPLTGEAELCVGAGADGEEDHREERLKVKKGRHPSLTI
jgi:hypothetical protein